jgi:hypothetical protein
MANWSERRERVWSTVLAEVERGETDARVLVDAVRREHGISAVLDLLDEVEKRAAEIPARSQTPRFRR